MLKAFLLVVLGGVAALEGERLLDRMKRRVNPRALTDGVLESANRRLEKERSGPS